MTDPVFDPDRVDRDRVDRGTSDVNWRSAYPFASHYRVVAPGVRQHFIDESPDAKNEYPSEPLLLVHGNPTWSFYYRAIVQHFRANRRVVAVDHVGCGLSDKPQRYNYNLVQHTENLITLIDSLDLRNITMVVHDWGGAIGLGSAVERLDRFRRILVLNTGAFPPPYVPWRIAACRLPLFGSWSIRYGNSFARAAVYMAINRLPKLNAIAREGLLAPYDSPANRIAIDRFVQDIPMSRAHPTWKVLDQLESKLPSLGVLPIHFVWGMRDWCFRPECMERLNQAWPNATRCELSDVGHYVMEEAPEQVIRELEKLLSK